MTGRFLVLVTGASRGFGKYVAEEFVRRVAPSYAVDLVLVARSGPGLESVAGAIDTITKTIPDVSEVVVRREVVDLGDLERLNSCLDAIFSELDPSRYAQAVLVSDAGSIGHVSNASELPSLAKLRSEMDFNVTSCFWLSSRFAAVFGAREGEDASCLKWRAAETPLEGGGGTLDDAAPKRNAPDASNNIVVNISSRRAVQPFETIAGYCSGKAARDMFRRVLAEEQMKVGGLKVLNYSPGLMQTEMAREIRTEAQYEGDLRNGGLLDPKISAEKSVGLVHDGGFESGAHVDFFDEFRRDVKRKGAISLAGRAHSYGRTPFDHRLRHFVRDYWGADLDDDKRSPRVVLIWPQ